MAELATRRATLALVIQALLACEPRPLATPDIVSTPAVDVSADASTPVVDASADAGASAAAPPVDDGEDIDTGADAGAPTAKDLKGNASASNAFSIALYEKLRSSPGNLVASGTSVRFACGMAQLGANGDTATAMASTLHTDPDPIRGAALARGERSDWSRVVDSELSIASHLWVSTRYPMRPGYLSMVADAYGAPSDSLDFGAKDSSRDTINRWVSTRTKGRIPSIIDDISPSTLAILTNAVYFNGKWTEKFEKGATKKDGLFHLDAGHTSKVAMMHQREQLSFAYDRDVKVLQKTYGKTGRMAMLFVLPHRVDGLEQVESSLSEAKLRSWTTSLGKRDVDLALPKFKIVRMLPLTNVLKELGMRSAFDPERADFSRLAPRGVYISDVLQKAVIEVEEEGTIAAAVTATKTLDLDSAWDPAPPPMPFIADHPFLFFIRDTATGRMLFMGRVVDPKG